MQLCSLWILFAGANNDDFDCVARVDRLKPSDDFSPHSISPSPVWLANGRQGESSAERLQGSQLS
jgi:hypothetical protein